ncbi:MAG: tRNA (guanosine(46)-N7)-methyltransferase TrmB [Parvularcula sp.]
MTTEDWSAGRLYGRRQAKPLRSAQRERFDSVLPDVAVSPETVAAAIQSHTGPVWLEVGFGGGEHLAWQATHHPDTLMIGAEPFLNGVAKLLGHIDEQALSNVRVCHGDARPLLQAIPDGALSRLFVLHPDPWPKTRHFKRRMISASFLQEAARLLKVGGTLRVSSDIPDYVRWTLMQVQLHNRQHPDFHWTARRKEDWTVRPDDWPQTRYEAKALKEGRTPAYLSFDRMGP